MRLKRLCLIMTRRWRLSQLTTTPLMRTRMRCAVFLALIVALVMALAWSEISRWRRAGMFPKIICPDSNKGSPHIAAQARVPDVYSTPQPMHQVPIGKWNFKAPQHMTSICGGDATGDATGAKQLLAFVPVTAKMTAEREAVRQTWGSELNSKFGQLLFLIQMTSGKPVDPRLTTEFAERQDLLLAFYSGDNSEDSYRLLVLKVVAGLRWYTLECRMGFDFVLKADHDSYWNVPSLLRLLQRHRPSEPLVLGSIQQGASVVRDYGSKFFIPNEVYHRAEFPPYASGGPGYALSRSAAVGISVLASRAQSRALWLEDVYLTGLLPEAAFPSCANSSVVSGSGGAGLAASDRFLHLHSDYIFICRYAELTPLLVYNWPPLAMHRVQGHMLIRLHAWMQTPGAQDRSERQHSIVYSHSSCSNI